MVNIVVSFWWKNPPKVKENLSYYEGLITKLRQQGNNVFVINMSYLSSYKRDIVSVEINKNLLQRVEEFSPDLFITFNNNIPKILLNKFLQIPIILFDGDDIATFNNLDYFLNNKERYNIFTICKEWTSQYASLGFDKKNIYYMLPATAITAIDMPQDKSISFLGGAHLYNDKILNLMDSSEFRSLFKNIFLDFINNSDYDFEKITYKHSGKTMEDLDIIPRDLFPLVDMRQMFLLGLLDMDLTIAGFGWDAYFSLFPMLKAAHFDGRVYTLSENESFYNSSKISLNIIHPQGLGKGFGWRVFDVMASNACLVSHSSFELKKLTKSTVDIPMFDSVEEARNLSKMLLKDDKTRRDIVKKSQNFVNKNCRWEYRFKDIEDIVGIKLIKANSEQGELINYSYVAETKVLKVNCEKIQPTKRQILKFRDKIRYKIWKHLNKKLEKKGII